MDGYHYGQGLKKCLDEVSYSVREFAGLAGVNSSTVYNTINRGKLPQERHHQSYIKVLDNARLRADLLNELMNTYKEVKDSRTKKPSTRLPVEARRTDYTKVWASIQSLIEDQRLSQTDRDLLIDIFERITDHSKSYLVAVGNVRVGIYPDAVEELCRLENELLSSTPSPIDQIRVRVFRRLAHALRYQGQPNEALKWLEKAAILEKGADENTKGIKDKAWATDQKQTYVLEVEMLAMLYMDEGNIYRRIGKLDDALEKYKSAKAVVDEAIPGELSRKDYPRLWLRSAIATRKQAGVKLFQGRSQQAEVLILDSIRQCQVDPEPDKEWLNEKRKGYQHLAWARSLQGRWENALEQHNEAMKIGKEQQLEISLIEEAKGLRYLAEVQQTIGIYHRDTLNAAKQSYRQSLEAVQKFYLGCDNSEQRDTEQLVLGAIYLGLAQVERYLGNLDFAKANLEKSEKMLCIENDSFHYARMIREKGRFAITNNDYENAQKYLEQARDIFSERSLNNRYYRMSITIELLTLRLQRAKEREDFHSVQESVMHILNGPDLLLADNNPIPDLIVPWIRAQVLLGHTILIISGSSDAATYYREAMEAADDLNRFLVREVGENISQYTKYLAKHGYAVEAQELREYICDTWSRVIALTGKGSQDQFNEWLNNFCRSDS